jgi:hypothetical protein
MRGKEKAHTAKTKGGESNKAMTEYKSTQNSHTCVSS